MQSSRTASACDAWLCNMHFCTVLDMIVQQLFMLLLCVGSLRGLRRTISCQKKVVNHYCEVFCFLLFDWWLLSIRVLSTIITICCLVVVQQSYSIIHKPLVHIIVFALIPDEFCNLWNDAGNLKKQPWSRCPIKRPFVCWTQVIALHGKFLLMHVFAHTDGWYQLAACVSMLEISKFRFGT